MNLRRRPKPEKVRKALTSTPTELVADEYAEEIVRLRGAMKQAADLLEHVEGRAVSEARVLLVDSLEREGWWKR